MATIAEILTIMKSHDSMKIIAGMKEIKELPNILTPGELPEHGISGIYEKGHGVLIATNKRVIFIDKGMLWGLKVEDFPLEKISSIQYEAGMLFGKVIIFTSGNKAIIEKAPSGEAKKFGEFLRNKINSLQENNSPKTSEDDMFVKLEKLAKLKEQGILSEDEFLEQKKRILTH